MSRKLGVAADALLSLWITLIVAQHLSGLATALWPSPAAGGHVDLRAGYWAIGALLLIGSILFRLMRLPEVCGDR